MSLTVVLPTLLRELNDGASTLALEGDPPTVRSAFEILAGTHPALHRRIVTESGDVRPHINVFVGGREIRRRDGLDTALDSNGELVILPAVSGG